MSQLSVLQDLDIFNNIINVYQHIPVLALGNSQGLQEEYDFIINLIHHPLFPIVVNDIVIDFGNSLYQDALDSFINGEIVKDKIIHSIIRDMIYSFNLSFQAPIYEQFFRAVRGINRYLPQHQRIRIWLAEPPIKWLDIKSRNDIIMHANRINSNFADITERIVLKEKRNVFLFAISSRVTRISDTSDDSTQRNVVQLIEQRGSMKVYVIIPHCGFPDNNIFIENKIKNLTIPSIIPLNDTFLGNIDLHLYFDEDKYTMPLFDYKGNPIPDATLKDAADAYLYIGQRDTLTMSRVDPAVYKGDQDYVQELQRRRQLWGVAPYPIDALYEERDPRYTKYGC